MKTLVCLLLFVLPFQWQTDFDIAKKTADQEHKLILLNFSGSDWCGPCILFTKEYLGSEDFSQIADKDLVCVNADFPRKSKNKLSGELTKSNEALAERYNKEGVFPFTLLLDAKGNVIKTWAGKPKETPSEWTSNLKSLIQSKK